MLIVAKYINIDKRFFNIIFYLQNVIVGLNFLTLILSVSKCLINLKCIEIQFDNVIRTGRDGDVI